MPKGVEHAAAAAAAADCPRVTTAVMPKGVEHGEVDFAARPSNSGVTTAVMPKGVEHMLTAADIPDEVSRDDSSDAERR